MAGALLCSYIVILFAVLLLAEKAALCIYCMMKRKKDSRRMHAGLRYGDNSGKGLKTGIGGVRRILNGYVRWSIIRLGRVPCHAYRNFVLRHVYRMDIGEDVVIYGGFEIRYPWNVHIGKGTIIGDDAKLDGRNGIYIGEHVNFSTGVWIWTEQHDIQDSMFADNDEGGFVQIGNRAWLSSRTTVLPKVTIGEGAVLAAGAVATKDIEPFTIAGGVPAKKIGERNEDLAYEFDGEFIPFY